MWVLLIYHNKRAEAQGAGQHAQARHHVRQELMPLTIRASSFHSPEPRLEGTIISFHETIGSWMTCGDAVLLYPHLFAVDPEAAKILPASVCAHLRGGPISTRDICMKPRGYPVAIEYPINYTHFNPFAKLTHAYY